MLTVEDANSIMTKYGGITWFYEIDLGKLSPYDSQWEYDFCSIVKDNSNSCYLIVPSNSFFTGNFYLKDSDGEFITDHVTVTEISSANPSFKFYPPSMSEDYIIGLQISPTLSREHYGHFCYINEMGFLPLESTVKPLQRSDEDYYKFYIHLFFDEDSDYAPTVDGVVVDVHTDSKGTYLLIPSNTSCVLGVQEYPGEVGHHDFQLYNVTFNEFKVLPNMQISTIYKGTPQQVTLINTDTETAITKFQAYYQGRLLKDNIINVPYSVDEYIDIVIELHDHHYVESTVKLKAKTEVCVCTTQAEVQDALDNGIKTIKVHPGGYDQVYLSGMTISDVTILNSNVKFYNCTLNNVTCIRNDNSLNKVTDNGRNTFNNCLFEVYDILVNGLSKYNDCTLQNIETLRIESENQGQINFTGTINNCNFNLVTIVSDGNITITNSTFGGKSLKDYFPSFLYLTGDYEVKGNTFTLSGTWSELAFNMCIIKANPDFNPSGFIANNTFNLNISYESEPTNTFYYNIVDDDKIRAVRLE